MFLPGTIVRTLWKTMFWKDILHLCLNWLAAVEHAKIEENTVKSGIFEGLGRWANWKHCQTWYFGMVLWRQMCKLLCVEGNHCKNMQTHSKNTGAGRFCRKKCRYGRKCCSDSFLDVVVVAIWNSLVWEAPTEGKNEKKHPLGSPHAGKSEQSIHWKIVAAFWIP